MPRSNLNFKLEEMPQYIILLKLLKKEKKIEFKKYYGRRIQIKYMKE